MTHHRRLTLAGLPVGESNVTLFLYLPLDEKTRGHDKSCKKDVGPLCHDCKKDKVEVSSCANFDRSQRLKPSRLGKYTKHRRDF